MPANKITLALLKARVLDRADMTGTGFIDSFRLTDYINSANSELHDLLVSTHEDYFLKKQTISLVSNTENYSLPVDFHKTLKMFIVDAGGARFALRRFNIDELDRLDSAYSSSTNDARGIRYRLIGDQIYFSPRPTITGSVEHWYIPEVVRMEDDLDTVDYSVPVGWEEYIVVDAAIRCLEKEESDISALMAHKQDLRGRILSAAPQRDTGEPDRIVDVSGRNRPWWAYV